MDGIIVYLLSAMSFKYTFIAFFAGTLGIQAAVFAKEAVTSVINNVVATLVMRKQVRMYRDIKGE